MNKFNIGQLVRTKRGHLVVISGMFYGEDPWTGQERIFYLTEDRLISVKDAARIHVGYNVIGEEGLENSGEIL